MSNSNNHETEKPSADSEVFHIVVDQDMIRAHSNELETRFAKELAQVGNSPVVLDLSTAHEIDSRGIVLCIGLFKECQARRLDFSILVSPDLYRYFRMLKLTTVIAIRQAKAK